MSNAAVETYPIISATALIGGNIVHRPGEGPAEIVPQPGLPAGNKDLCRRFVQKILNEGELSLIGDFMSPGVVNHEVADSLGDTQARQGHGIKWMTELVYLYRRAFPDLRFEILDQIAEGDRVVTSLRMRGTQEGFLMTIAPSGREIDVAGIRIDRVIGGRIVESWFHVDSLGMLRQLDALPLLNRRPQAAPVSRETAPGQGLPAAAWKPAAAARAAWVS
ncbi:MAG TPA: ester cyclase [Thermoanaerobaculia bacterium]|nr:ester cyclase [Thermoanaerobaculia bacterium]